MEHLLSLGEIPEEHYIDYKYETIFGAYKWDPQVEDHNTVAKQVVLLSKETANQLSAWVEQLAKETMELEKALALRPDLIKKLGLPKKIEVALKTMPEYNQDDHVRLMRFDLHPTTSGWALSEVNSDVPGGLAEASLLPEIAKRFFPGYSPSVSVGDSILNSFKEKIDDGSTMAFIHATSYSDDRQVMQFLADRFEKDGYKSILAAPDHIIWQDKNPICILGGRNEKVDGLARFYPLEWLAHFPKKVEWNHFYDTKVPSCNHPAAILSQSKRVPIIWDQLGIDLSTWKSLLPETKEPKEVSLKDESWIYKPALGRVGGDISIKAAIPKKEYDKIRKTAHRYHKDWAAQKMFESQPFVSQNGIAYHLCIGAFTVDGKSAGFYGRISKYSRIDERAEDIPVLVMGE